MVLLLSCMVVGLRAQSADREGELAPSRQREYAVLFNEAMLQRQKSNHAAVFDLLTRCIETDPHESASHFFLAQYYMEMKDMEQNLASNLGLN